MRKHLVVSSLILATGCAGSLPLSTIQPVAPPAATGMVLPTASLVPGPSTAGVEHPADVGNWFYRSVYAPEGEHRKLYAVEIIYCPTERAIFTECRVAIAWSREGRGGLGEQLDAPPSPVPERYITAEASAEQKVAPIATTSAPREDTLDVVNVGGHGYFEIPASDLAKLRSWNKRTVGLALSYGKSTSGQLTGIDAPGLQIYRNGQSALYKWEELASIALQAP